MLIPHRHISFQVKQKPNKKHSAYSVIFRAMLSLLEKMHTLNTADAVKAAFQKLEMADKILSLFYPV